LCFLGDPIIACAPLTSNQAAYKNHGVIIEPGDKITRYGSNKDKTQSAAGILPANFSERLTDHWLPGKLFLGEVFCKVI